MTAEAAAMVQEAVTQESQQVLTFTLGAESYGVDILRVQEIRGWTSVTRIPQAPEHVLGVLNLRGSIVPIIDLRRRFGIGEAAFTPLTVIIVLLVELPGGRREFGLVVDGVSDVVDITATNMKPPPEIGGRVDGAFLKGLATVSDAMVILLDVDTLISKEVALVAVEEQEH
ncbi:MAG: purine-binding chemotaxis protein CheW [Gammaproteobacteria bacterium]|nr:MAG: purine-binding chemotaxis protein CheW [Gammaproteobacteria bacterium]